VQRTYLADQYSDADKLRIRIETHRRYSEGTETLTDDILDALALAPGLSLLDVGCGSGEWHARLAAGRVVTVGLDLMPGMLQAARVAGAGLEPRPELICADAQAIPFQAATFDRVLCSGVLYHVPDCRTALAEMRRVLRPGGLAVISTNGADTMERLSKLHADASRALGYTPTRVSGERGHFSMNDLPLVQSVFPSAKRHLLEGALVFAEAEPAVRFYATNRIDGIENRPSDNRHRAELVPLVRKRIEAIIEREGAFRVPKSVGWFVAHA
jgi:ubiquinone/menaquinone biosynthesis C-methylase UbiE